MLQVLAGGKAQRVETKPGGWTGWVLDSIRRLALAGGARAGAKRQMHLIETLPVGGRKQLLLVACGAERFLVGTGLDSVQTIVRIDPEWDVDGSRGTRGLEDSF